MSDLMEVAFNTDLTAVTTIAKSLWLAVFALHFGILTHIVKKVVELRASDPTATMSGYLKSYRYQAFLTFVSAVVGFVMLMNSGELTLVTAFMAGYMCNSLTDASRK